MSLNMIPKIGFSIYKGLHSGTQNGPPIFSRTDEDGLVTFGFWITEAHCDHEGHFHDTMLAAFADKVLGLACTSGIPQSEFLRTLSLKIDHRGLTSVGAWLEITPCILKRQQTDVFTQVRVTSDDSLIAMVTATYADHHPQTHL